MKNAIMNILERFFSSYREILADMSGRFVLIKILIIPFLTFFYVLTSLVILTMILIVLLIVIPAAAISRTKIPGSHPKS